jgi:hypothetical protein
MVRPWAEAGFKCVCVDIAEPIPELAHKNIQHVNADVLSYKWTEQPSMVFAFPPCTHTAISGSKWFKKKGLRALIEALQTINACKELAEQSGSPWMLENPVGTVSTYWRAADYIFNPYEYAGYKGGDNDTYPKKTCLWTGGGFVMPEPKPLPVTDSRIHMMPESKARAYKRSITPLGFAQAVFEANVDKINAA